MPAITVAFTTIGATATNPDKPLDSALMTAFKDRTQHLLEWLGKDYTAGAVQNHNHDGVNSALVEIGPNYLRNGSFEQGTEGFTLSPYTGGSITTNTANDMDGATALAITSTSIANGGGLVTSTEYVPITGGEAIELDLAVKASVANVSARMEAAWYDDAQAQISVTTMYNVTNTPTANTRLVLGAAAPANARFCKVRLTGGVPGAGSATGTVYFDGLRLGKGLVAEAGGYVSSPTVSGTTISSALVLLAEIVAPRSGVFTTVISVDGNGWSPNGRVYKNGAAFGTLRGNGTYNENLSFMRGDLIQLYLAQQSGAGLNADANLRIQELRPLGMAAISMSF